MFIFTAIIRLISVVETSQKNKSKLQKDAKIQSYLLEFKLSVIENAEEHGNSPTTKNLVSYTMKRTSTGGAKGKRLDRCGTNTIDSQLKEELIMCTAKTIYDKKVGVKGFKASKGWL